MGEVVPVRLVRRPGPLALTDEVRAVPISRSQVEELQRIAVALGQMGAGERSSTLLGIVAAWKAAR